MITFLRMRYLKFNNLNVAFTDRNDGNMKDISSRKKVINQFPIKDLLIPNQKHTDNIVNEKNIKKEEADGVFINRKFIAGGVLTADCMPIIISDFTSFAVIHAGWRGLLKGIIQKGLDFFEKKENLFVFIGASARKCCYEVQEDFIKKTGIDERYIYRGEKTSFSMQELAIDILREQGVKNIFDAGICTICNNSYFSYRRGYFNERILTFAWLED